jgi:alpha-ribazole phosphatase
MLKIHLIRHGMTPGNALSRYIGSTDEPLSEEGRALLKKKRPDQKPDILFVSPLLRCRQSAEILFPGMEMQVIPDLAEFDFGIFENKNYQELSGSMEYQAWVDSFCEAPVPGGESMASFKTRILRGFDQVIEICRDLGGISSDLSIALVVHGGTIMSLMEAYAEEKRGYYDWHVANGEGYSVDLDLNNWLNSQKIVHNIRHIM